MATAPTATTEQITIAVPTDVLRELDDVAARMGMDRGEVIAGAARRFLLGEQRWRRLQTLGAEHARAADLRTEDDIEEYLDSLSG